MPTKKTTGQKKTTSAKEEFIIDGKELLGKVEEIIKEGNARKITLYSEEGQKMMEIPLTWAAIGALLAPVLAAVGAFAALVTKCRVVVEKK